MQCQRMRRRKGRDKEMETTKVGGGNQKSRQNRRIDKFGDSTGRERER